MMRMLLLLFSLMILSCEDGAIGPMGPQGDSGIDGKNGSNGLDGEDGKDGKDGKDGLIIIQPDLDSLSSIYVKKYQGFFEAVVSWEYDENGSDGHIDTMSQNLFFNFATNQIGIAGNINATANIGDVEQAGVYTFTETNEFLLINFITTSNHTYQYQIRDLTEAELLILDSDFGFVLKQYNHTDMNFPGYSRPGYMFHKTRPDSLIFCKE